MTGGDWEGRAFMFDFSHLGLEIEFLDDYAPAGFWGARLRGGYGAALKRGLCDHPRIEQCRECPRFLECDFPRSFKPQRSALHVKPQGHPLRNDENLPAPFVIDPPPFSLHPGRAGDRLRFGLVSFGAAAAQPQYAVNAFAAFGRAGIGSAAIRPVRFRLHAIYDLLGGGKRIAITPEHSLAVTTRDITGVVAAEKSIAAPTTLQIHFLTPVRVRLTNARRLDPASGLALFSDFYDFVFDLAERVAALWQLYGKTWHGQAAYFRWREKLLQASRRIQLVGDNFRMVPLERHSNLQDADLHMDGFVGTMDCVGDFAPLMELLQLGEIIHVGQMTTFGLGRFVIATSET